MSAVSCNVAGCDKSWARDPVLEVKCPTCGAEAGRNCRRPSGHATWGRYGRFCDPRDLAANAVGAYGECPLGGCGKAQAIPAPDLPLFAGIAA